MNSKKEFKSGKEVSVFSNCAFFFSFCSLWMSLSNAQHLNQISSCRASALWENDELILIFLWTILYKTTSHWIWSQYGAITSFMVKPLYTPAHNLKDNVHQELWHCFKEEPWFGFGVFLLLLDGFFWDFFLFFFSQRTWSSTQFFLSWNNWFIVDLVQGKSQKVL